MFEYVNPIITDIERAIEEDTYKWNHIKVNDLYGLLEIYFKRKNNKPFYLKKASESVNKERQREIIHLVEILLVANSKNVRLFSEQLQQYLPDKNNSIQPLYNPSDESDDQPLLKVQVNEDINLILRRRTTLLEFPTEV
jgi:hypothetical protein